MLKTWTVACVTMIALLPVGCSSAPARTPVRAPAPFAHGLAAAPTPASQTTLRRPLDTDAAHAVRLARSLLGVRYDFGGDDRSGFDCSGLVSYVLAQVGVRLPRTAADQKQAGLWVAPDELRAGDLVFFSRMPDKPFHVGLVVSAPGAPLAMIHASTSRGVVEETIDADSHWRRYAMSGRRVLTTD